MVEIVKRKISDKIFLLEFKNQYEITSTFLRFQEHYESPEFSGKIFSLEDYKAWYIKIKGKFSYYTDWNGFNIPSYVLKPFYEGKFDPLSVEEKQILDLFKNDKEPFYVIATHKGNNLSLKLLRHEISHALFYISPEYNSVAMSILNKYDLSLIRDELKSSGGYNEKVMNDELLAYCVSGEDKLNNKFPENMKKEVQNLFEKYWEKVI